MCKRERACSVTVYILVCVRVPSNMMTLTSPDRQFQTAVDWKVSSSLKQYTAECISAQQHSNGKKIPYITPLNGKTGISVLSWSKVTLSLIMSCSEQITEDIRMSQVTTNMSLHVWRIGWVTLWRRDSISFSNLNLFQLYPSVRGCGDS